MPDLVDGDDQREVPDHLRQGARHAKSVDVAPVAEIDLRLNWATRTGAREVAMDEEPAFHVEVQLLRGASARSRLNHLNLAVAFSDFTEQLRLRIQLVKLRIAIKVRHREHDVFRKAAALRAICR